MGVHPLLDLRVDLLGQVALRLHTGDGHLVVDAVLHGLIVPDRQDLEQPAQHRYIRSRSREGRGDIQARHQHSQTGGHAARSPPDHLITAATAAGPALPDACADPGVQLLRNGGGLIFFSCTLEFVHN